MCNSQRVAGAVQEYTEKLMLEIADRRQYEKDCRAVQQEDLADLIAEEHEAMSRIYEDLTAIISNKKPISDYAIS